MFARLDATPVLSLTIRKRTWSGWDGLMGCASQRERETRDLTLAIGILAQRLAGVRQLN